MEYNIVVFKQKWYQNKIFIIVMIFLILTIFVGNIALILNSYNKKEEMQISKILNKKVDLHTYEFKKYFDITDEVKSKVDNIYNSEEKIVYLTFDDGPSKTVTLPILDLLKQENIKATFFVLGSRVEFYPEIVKRAYDEGHYIANHGYSHKYDYIYSNPYTVLEEYNKTEQLIKNALGDQGYNSHLFRFPGGSKGGKYNDIKKEAINILRDNNILYLDWNSLTGDSEGKKTREEMMKYLIDTVGEKKSVVILMHDAGNKTITYEMLPEIIAYLRNQGYNFKNFYDILE